ncbi:hypothetical protein [uncultured Methanobrevibacter sp.]|uniref:hypothetical protein n=1 Tax=uncultured Methanobrevibacter sp. TaxID=253161 RepID=UPI0025D20DB8|nr:hypothetical protein [uncultured Methanobrevibacter sp.]
MNELHSLAKGILETIAAEDEEYFQKNGFYTMRTRAGECKVLVFEIPREQRKLEEFYKEMII